MNFSDHNYTIRTITPAAAASASDFLNFEKFC